jgi:cytochrome b561
LPITLLGPVALPGIAPHNIDVFAVLRECHGAFAFLLFLTFTAHMSAVLFHTLVLRDRLIDRMALWRTEPVSAQPGEAPEGADA